MVYASSREWMGVIIPNSTFQGNMTILLLRQETCGFFKFVRFSRMLNVIGMSRRDLIGYDLSTLLFQRRILHPVSRSDCPLRGCYRDQSDLPF
jgi:hypothetical protein